jgi:predicted NUDIX family NTP pyrophosphohydrolase
VLALRITRAKTGGSDDRLMERRCSGLTVATEFSVLTEIPVELNRLNCIILQYEPKTGVLSMAESARETWVTYAEAARKLDCSIGTVRNMVRDGFLTVRQFPSGRPRVLLSDVENIARTSITAASK